MQTVSDIFDVFGGNAAVAKLLGVGPSAASEMKRRQNIPVKYWNSLLDVARESGRTDLTLEVLVEIMSRPKERPEQDAGVAA